MIDFRYHLVSLVSVFMALAIGVVLGAGPLKESIGDTLTSQVQGLRDDKEALQQAVENRDAALLRREEAITALSGAVVPGTLADRAVSVITLPGAVGADVDELTAELTESGATVASTVAVQPGWTDPAQGSARADVADGLLQYLLPGQLADGSPAEQMAALLTRAVLSSNGGERDSDGIEVLDALIAAELVTVTEDGTRRADLAVVVTGAPADTAGAGDEGWSEADIESTIALAVAADQASAGAVVLGPTSADTDAAGVISALRADADAAGEVSSVDVLEKPLGRLAGVLALLEQTAGGVGHYGVGPDASSVLPPVPTPATQDSTVAPAPTGTDG